MAEIPKMVRDGKVAVLYSPGYGAGWSTWGAPREALFDPELVAMVERRADPDEMAEYAERKWPEVYTGGLRDLKIRWLSVGTAFRVHEYDGSESIEEREEMDWILA